MYAHYSKNADGTWLLNVESVDGYKAYSKKTRTSTTLKGLLENYLYAHKATAGGATTVVYYTEVHALSEAGAWGE